MEMLEQWNQYKEIFQNSFLFKGIQPTEILKTAQKTGGIRSFPKGTVIYGRNHFQKSIGILLEGNASVVKSVTGSVVLNTLRPSDSFGVAAVFNDQELYVSNVVAQKACIVYFISALELEELFKENFLLLKNYLSFLSEKICFLNRKIDGFTAVSAQQKLALYLRDYPVKVPDGTIACNVSQLAKVLGVGRASLYRALDSLQELSLIEKGNKFIRVLDREGLISLSRYSEE